MITKTTVNDTLINMLEPKSNFSTSAMIGSIFSSLISSSIANMCGTVAGHPLDTIRVSQLIICY